MKPKSVSFNFRVEGGKYINEEKIVYFSPRFQKTVTVEPGYKSDGSTGGEDIVSLSWWVHDKVSDTEKWDDGSRCDARQRSWILHDILRSEGRWFRCKSWGIATYIYQRVKELIRSKPKPPTVDPHQAGGVIRAA